MTGGWYNAPPLLAARGPHKVSSAPRSMLSAAWAVVQVALLSSRFGGRADILVAVSKADVQRRASAFRRLTGAPRGSAGRATQRGVHGGRGRRTAAAPFTRCFFQVVAPRFTLSVHQHQPFKMCSLKLQPMRTRKQPWLREALTRARECLAMWRSFLSSAYRCSAADSVSKSKDASCRVPFI